MDNSDQAETTEHQVEGAEQTTDAIESKTSDIAVANEPVETTAPTTTSVENSDNQLITSNVNVELKTDDIVALAGGVKGSAVQSTAAIATDNIDPGLDTVALEANEFQVKNSSLSTKELQALDTVKQQANVQENDAAVAAAIATADTDTKLSSLDAALDNLSDQVNSLLDENSASKVKNDSPDAPLDEALATLNSEVLGLLKESRKIQNELKQSGDSKTLSSTSGSKSGSRSALNQSPDIKNQYFDYSLYRERSASPPPHPLTTYQWEDIRRDKEKGGYPWTYLHPQDILAQKCQPKSDDRHKAAPSISPEPIAIESPSVITDTDPVAIITAIEVDQPVLIFPTSLLREPRSSLDVLSFNFDNIDTQRAIDSYSTKSSVKNSSSGILEVLQDLEAEEERENERKQRQLKTTTTQSQQDLSTFKPKEESKRFAFRSLLKRTHSAPKKIEVTKNRADDDLDRREKSPPQVQCCHPIVEKLKTMADKQLHKKAVPPKKPAKIKSVQLPNEKKIVLAEHTRIIRLKDSPKAERKNVAAYLEKRDSDDVVEIVQLDESPTETRKRRDENRKLDEADEQQHRIDATESGKNVDEPDFVVPQNLTGSDTEPTVEELLEEEFKNDPPKKAPRKTKEHIYEEIGGAGAITTYAAGKLQKPGNLFASAVLHSVLNKDEFKENLKRQNEIEDEEDEKKLPQETTLAEEPAKNDTIEISSKPIPDEIIELTVESEVSDEAKDESKKDEMDAGIEITVEQATGDDEADEEGEVKDDDARKDVLTKEEKKVKFSQSTEEYQERIAAEKSPEKEDVELVEPIKVSKRWSNMSDHEYEPIGEPSTESVQPVVVTVTSSQASEPTVIESIHLQEQRATSVDGTESPIRSITPYTDDITRTEDLHTSQVDDSMIEELPLRREDRTKPKSFITAAGEHTKNFQHKISSQASNLRTKFKRNKSEASGSNLSTSLKSSPKTSQTSAKERKRKRIDFTNKLKSIHMPKMPQKFTMPEKFKLSRHHQQGEMVSDGPVATVTTETESTIGDPSAMATVGSSAPTVVSSTREEIFEMKTTSPKKRFEFGSYPKIFNRFKSQKSDDQSDAVDGASELDTEHESVGQPSSSSFSTHFATVPRTASRIKKTIISKWNKTKQSRHGEDSESGAQSHDDDLTRASREDSVERRIRLASKVSMQDDEEEALGILQTKEQIQLASYDEENRAIHEISRAREKEFKARQPLTHQDSDLVSEESNREIDWEECERMRNKIMGITPTYVADVEPKRHPRRPRNDSNFSTEETQSSGSSGDRRRTGVIEDIDDDEFFLRQRGVSQDNAEISKYISSAIREGMIDDHEAQFTSYAYDDNNEDFPNEYQRFGTERPIKPLRRRQTDGYNRSFESYDDYHGDHLSDTEVPVATQYFPRHDDEENDISFYDNEFDEDDIDHHVNILTHDDEDDRTRYDSDVDNEVFRPIKVQPEAPKRRRKGKTPTKQDSIETNEEVLIYRSEPSISQPPEIETVNTQLLVKPPRRNRSKNSSKSDLTHDNQSIGHEPTTVQPFSPENGKFTIDIKETNGYATVKKEPPARPPAPVRRQKRSAKMSGESKIKDSPFPERAALSPTRPPRRGSSSSLVDQQKPPSIAPSDGTQYEEIDDDLEVDDEMAFFKMQNRPLPAPPRPPRDKRRPHRSRSASEKKFDDNDAGEAIVAGSFDDGTSDFSTREFIGTEMATQTSMDIDDLYLPDDDIPLDEMSQEQYSKTVEEILRGSSSEAIQHGSNRTSDDNLSKGIQRFRESNQRSYSERSRASTDRSRPITPAALVIEQRIARSPILTDATLIMQPVADDSSKSGFRTDSNESEQVPYADDGIDTEDERIINAAIRRYQMLGSELEDLSPQESTPRNTDDRSGSPDRRDALEVPLPPPRRKSSTNATQVAEALNVPLAEAESISIESTQELNRTTATPEPVNDLSADNIQATANQVESLTVVNIQHPAESVRTSTQDTKLQISPEVMQEIIERVRETLPVQTTTVVHEQRPVDEAPAVNRDSVVESTPTKGDEKKDGDEPPKRPPSPTDYTPTSEIPASFYQLRTGISDDESVPSIPPAATLPKTRPPRKHTRRPEDSSSDDECHRRHHHHHHSHHGAAGRSQDSSIADLSGQLIRACGRALNSSLNTTGHAIIDFIRSLTKNQDDQQKDLSLVLVILIIIVASLMLLGLSGDRSVHHHHWNFLNPPDNVGRR